MEATVSTEQAVVAEPCAHCGALLANDQRYCLECGAPRTYLSGLQQLDGLRAASLGAPPVGVAPYAQGAPYQEPAYPYDSMSYGAPPAPHAGSRWGGPAGILAGVGVLLLAVGVGVLIGRSDSGVGKAAVPPAQVITVDQAPAAGTGTVIPTETNASKTPPPSSGKSSAKKSSSSKHNSSGSSAPSGSGSGVGESVEKPAPASVLKNEKSKGGGSYEQKSKSLPNVVLTG